MEGDSYSGDTVNISTTVPYTGPMAPWSYCPHCGQKLEVHWKHCSHCGVKVGSSPARPCDPYPAYPYYPNPYIPPYGITWTSGGTVGNGNLKQNRFSDTFRSFFGTKEEIK